MGIYVGDLTYKHFSDIIKTENLLNYTQKNYQYDYQESEKDKHQMIVFIL
jgi:hypothetical protein